MGSSFGLCVIMGLPSFSLLVLFVAVTHGLDVSSEIERDVETAEYIKVCEAGYFCDWKNFFKKKICPKGHFCPKNSFKPTPCPLSTYASEVGLKAESECKTCPPGSYCVGFGLNKPSGPCNAGYFCPSGSIHPDEEDCAKGSYCPEGTARPIECPAGTYQPFTRVKSLSSCKPCPAGKFCGKPGLSAPDGFCSAGQFCPTGSTKATPCPAGTYQPMARQSSCDACMEGEFCAGQGLHLPTGPCQPGFFCPAGSRKVMRKNVPKEPTVQLDLHCQSIVEQAHTNQKLARPNSPIAWPVILESTVVGQAWPRLMVPASDTTIVPVAICRLTLHNSCVLRDISVARELRLLLLVPRVISVLRGRGNHPNAQ